MIFLISFATNTLFILNEQYVEYRPLQRLIPGTEEYFLKGHLLGAGLTSSNPAMDTLATAFLFLNVPWYTCLFFFKQWKRDLAEDMSWAFTQGVSGILSNTFRGKQQSGEHVLFWGLVGNATKY